MSDLVLVGLVHDEMAAELALSLLRPKGSRPCGEEAIAPPRPS